MRHRPGMGVLRGASMSALWIVTPCYRDVPSFTILRRRTIDALGADAVTQRCAVRFVLVDDTAGLDPEVAELAAFADTQVIEPPFNLGHQRALVYAVRTIAPDLAPDDIVVTLDADGQDAPEDIPRLVAAVLDVSAPPGAVALAERTTRRESIGFKLGYRLFTLVFRLLTGTVIRTGNFAAYGALVARQRLRHPYFDLCYSSSFVSLDAPLVLVPCARRERLEGRSRMNRARLCMHGLRMLMPFLDRIAVRALMSFSVVFATAIAGVVLVVATRFLTDEAIPGWATYSVLGAFIISLLALSTALVLFASFAQSRGVSLSDLETQHGHGARSTSVGSG